MTDDPLAPLLAARGGVVVLDGGTATTLARRGHDLSDHLWSARLLQDDPGAITGVHRAFLRAGADIVITASYQASIEGFARAGLTEDEARALLTRSVELARRARAATGRPEALVAASIGPYGAALADGSEYRGDYAVGDAELARFHRARLAVLSGAGPDLLAIETIPSAREAALLVGLLEDIPGPPAWMTFVGRDGTAIADGTPFAEVAGIALGCPRILGVGLNCTPPELVAPLLGSLEGRHAHRIAYPNLGDRWEPASGRWRRDGPIPTALVDGWRAAGADVIGGCCGTTPSHIAALARHLGR